MLAPAGPGAGVFRRDAVPGGSRRQFLCCCLLVCLPATRRQGAARGADFGPPKLCSLIGDAVRGEGALGGACPPLAGQLLLSAMTIAADKTAGRPQKAIAVDDVVQRHRGCHRGLGYGATPETTPQDGVGAAVMDKAAGWKDGMAAKLNPEVWRGGNSNGGS